MSNIKMIKADYDLAWERCQSATEAQNQFEENHPLVNELSRTFQQWDEGMRKSLATLGEERAAEAYEENLALYHFFELAHKACEDDPEIKRYQDHANHALTEWISAKESYEKLIQNAVVN